MGFLTGYLHDKFIQWAENKIKENPLFQKLTGHIPIVASHNSELNQLLEKAIIFARTNSIVTSLQDDEIISSIDENIDIISECIILPREHRPLSNFLTQLQYTNDNEENRRQVETFYKSLYEQIHNNKQNYPTLQNIQIQNELGNIREEMRFGFNSTHVEFQEQKLLLKTIIDYESLSYNSELYAIENKIQKREFTIAREMALNLEEKIKKNNKQEEIEKLYALIINTYLLEGGKQEGVLDYFDNLIVHTIDKKKKKARNILRLIIRKDFINAQMELDNVFQESSGEKIDFIFYENQINLYFLSFNFNAAYNFINVNKEHIESYQYFLALTLIQQRKFEDAKNLLEDNKDFFNNTDFGIQEVKIEIRSHFLLQELRKTMTIDIINELKELSIVIKTLIANAGDCRIKISYLHSINAIILAATYEKEAAKSEYEKALELDSDNYNVLKNYPYLLLDDHDNMKKGLGLIQKYLEKYPDSLEDKILYYSILTEVNPEKVISEISEQENIEIEIKIYLVYALDITNQHTKAESRLKEMLEEYKNNFSVHFCAGWHYNYINEPLLALELFMEAYPLCKNENDYDSVFHYLLRIVCSEHYMDKMNIIKGWLEAKYNRTLILLKYPQFYIHMLLVLNDYKNCIECCDELRKNDSNSEYIANAEFACYYNTQNFQKVKQVLIENRIKYSDDILIRMAHSCASIGEYDLTKEILKKTKKPESKEEYMILARLLFSIKEYHDALKTIHDAYQKYPDERSIQESFIRLVFGHHIQSQTEEIANSFGNCLESYRMAEYKNKIFSEISIPKDATGEDILELISKQFPNDPDIDKRLELIRIHRLPITFYQSTFRKSLFSIHDMVTHSRNGQIWCTEQFEKSLNIQVSPVYIDLSSLITLDLLGLLNVVKSLFPKIYFTQSVLNAILSFDNELSQPHCEHVIIHYGDNDDFIRNRTHEKIITELKERIERIKSFVLSGGNIQIIGTVIKPQKVIEKRIDDFFLKYNDTDISESDTMRLGYTANCQTMMESVALRAAFDSFENSPKSFGIDSLLKYLLEKSLISKQTYFLSLTMLIENNYKQIPVSIEHMFFIIQYEGYTISQKHTKFFNFLSSQEFDFKDIVAMLANLLTHIWNDIAPSEEKKIEWSDYLLGIMTLNPLMNDEWEYKILNYVGTNIKTRQNSISYIEYQKHRMLKLRVS